ncbi:MAG: NTP transferase domain-containing protein [Aeromicrobium sp.]|uniref:NTP transferase domain-containing protein n=1 Tax=Aeromicrobium sp. TaxID=1871063 RepID=UPI002631F908|nr:NTP transferase domain-containing protein [Aeromicrobium sp.]MDF1704924.1 NTP transferase domain-containing protein [Aeromicrobium sp.]
MPERRWTAVVPALPFAMSLPQFTCSPADRERLAHAMTLDVLEATLGAGSIDRVVVVSTERALSHLAGADDRLTLALDRPWLNERGVRDAIALGALHARRLAPDSGVVVVPADLAAITPTVLDETLARLLDRSAAVVRDSRGRGHTLRTWADPTGAVAASHRRDGTESRVEVVAEVDARARHDVDTLEDLQAAVPLGLGPRTHVAARRVRRAVRGVSVATGSRPQPASAALAR